MSTSAEDYAKNIMDNLAKQRAESDAEIAVLVKADKEYQSDNDLEKRIRTYESVLLNKTRWNSFNKCMILDDMYLSAGMNDRAWGYLNQMSIWFATYPNPSAYLSKIELARFKILKKEKRYPDALRTLLCYHCCYTDSGLGYRRERFISDAKVIAKKLSISDDRLTELANEAAVAVEKNQNSARDMTTLVKKYLSI